MTDLSVRDVRPYLRGACRVTGPIDATINLTLNAGIAAYFLAGSGPVPIWGLPSVYGFFGPMVACVLGCTVLSGYRQGTLWVNASSRRWCHWLLPGMVLGGLTAACGSVLCWLAICGVDWWYAGQPWTAWRVILADGLVAALLGYSGQVAGVWLAVRRSWLR